jgi:sugar fermentation stimulation protein A
MLKRNSQFTATVKLNGETFIAHVATTNRLGDVNIKKIPCLLSYHSDKKRKYKYDIDAVLLSDDDNWVGINQILSNRLVEFFLKTHQLDEMVEVEDEISREVKLGKSKIDFKVGNTYIEVKTPLTVINVKYGKNIKARKYPPFNASERFEKHIKELTEALEENEKAIILMVNQYIPTEIKPHLKSTHYKRIKKIVRDAVDNGVEFWTLNLKFSPEGISFYDLKETTEEALNY